MSKSNYNEGYVNLELNNHSDALESVLPESCKNLLDYKGAASCREALDVGKEGWKPEVLGEVDHRLVKAPYIRMSHYTMGDQGDYVFLFDLRFTQPNKNYMETRVLHSLEHILLAGFRKYLDGFVSVAPMGCQTGFYLITINFCNAYKITSTFEKILSELLSLNEVPYNTDRECGQAAHHDLEGAKRLAEKVLAQKTSWLNVLDG